jgi:hypothetical protein
MRTEVDYKHNLSNNKILSHWKMQITRLLVRDLIIIWINSKAKKKKLRLSKLIKKGCLNKLIYKNKVQAFRK